MSDNLLTLMCSFGNNSFEKYDIDDEYDVVVNGGKRRKLTDHERLMRWYVFLRIYLYSQNINNQVHNKYHNYVYRIHSNVCSIIDFNLTYLLSIHIIVEREIEFMRGIPENGNELRWTYCNNAPKNYCMRYDINTLQL